MDPQFMEQDPTVFKTPIFPTTQAPLHTKQNLTTPPKSIYGPG